MLSRGAELPGAADGTIAPPEAAASRCVVEEEVGAAFECEGGTSPDIFSLL